MSQEALKNCVVKPSGPGALSPSMPNIVLLISFDVTDLIKSALASSVIHFPKSSFNKDSEHPVTFSSTVPISFWKKFIASFANFGWDEILFPSESK